MKHKKDDPIIPHCSEYFSLALTHTFVINFLAQNFRLCKIWKLLQKEKKKAQNPRAKIYKAFTYSAQCFSFKKRDFHWIKERGRNKCGGNNIPSNLIIRNIVESYSHRQFEFPASKQSITKKSNCIRSRMSLKEKQEKFNGTSCVRRAFSLFFSLTSAVK